jgi:hypothetical protein
MSSKALVSSLAIAAAVAVPVADAHTLSKATAKREAAKFGVRLARSVGGQPVYDCTRRGAHVVVCRVSVVALDGAVCVSRVRVAFTDRRGRTVSRRVVSGPDCEPPGLP